MVTYNYLGFGVTDNDGKAKLDHDTDGEDMQHSYTGIGAGLVDVVASLTPPSQMDGSSLQETVEVLDCTLRDGGISSDKNNAMWSLARGTLERGSESTELSITSGQTNMMAYFDLTNTDSFTIEFDCIFDCDSTVSEEIQFRNSSWSVIANTSIGLGNFTKDTWTHIKIEYKNGTIFRWVGETAFTPKSVSNLSMFVFQITTDDAYLKFKNFQYYPI